MEEEWSGASPTPPFGGVAPFRGSAIQLSIALLSPFSDIIHLLMLFTKHVGAKAEVLCDKEKNLKGLFSRSTNAGGISGLSRTCLY